MKKSAPLILSLMLGFSALNANQASAAEDYSKHWANEAIVYGIEQGYIKGNENGEILPDKNITRAEFATLLVGALMLTPVTAENITYSDVKEGDWYYNTVQTASQNKLIFGDTTGTFRPNDLITREEMAAILLRAAKNSEFKTLSLQLLFSDAGKISNWAKSDVQQLLSLGVMTGHTNNTFEPQGKSTRAQAFSSVKRFLEIDPENPIKYGQQYIQKYYNTDYNKALETQAKNTPKVDGGGVFIASKELVSYYMHPQSFDTLDYRYYQFLKLDSVVENIDVNVINKTALNNSKGTLYNKADKFVEVGKNLGMNALYLMSHAIHETGNGTSKLALGVEVGLNASNKATMVTDENRASLTAIKLTYNMYGIRAVDATPVKSGSEYAYENGWFTPDLAIEGGAAWINKQYIIGRGQNTLYKMRWSPSSPGSYQYATHVQWAEIQAKKIHDFYKLTGSDQNTLAIFEIPNYANQPSPLPLPPKDKWYAVGPKNAGKTGVVANTNSVNFRSYPVVTNDSYIGSLLSGTEVKINGENGGWYNVTTAQGQTGWVSGDYLTIK